MKPLFTFATFVAIVAATTNAFAAQTLPQPQEANMSVLRSLAIYSEKGEQGLAELNNLELYDLMLASSATLAASCGLSAQAFVALGTVDTVLVPFVALGLWLTEQPVTTTSVLSASYQTANIMLKSMNRDTATSDYACGMQVRRTLDVANEMQARGLVESMQAEFKARMKSAGTYTKAQLKKLGKVMADLAARYSKYAESPIEPKIEW